MIKRKTSTSEKKEGFFKRDYKLITIGVLLGVTIGYIWGWNQALNWGIETFDKILNMDLAKVSNLKELLGRLR